MHCGIRFCHKLPCVFINYNLELVRDPPFIMNNNHLGAINSKRLYGISYELNEILMKLIKNDANFIYFNDKSLYNLMFVILAMKPRHFCIISVISDHH